MYTTVIGTEAPLQEENSRTEGKWSVFPPKIAHFKTVFKWELKEAPWLATWSLSEWRLF